MLRNGINISNFEIHDTLIGLIKVIEKDIINELHLSIIKFNTTTLQIVLIITFMK